jgi:hypothetical protein
LKPWGLVSFLFLYRKIDHCHIILNCH